MAFESNGAIRGLEFLALEDTPGLGMRASEDVFREPFEGKGREKTDAEFSEGLAPVINGNKKVGFIDRTGGLVVEL